MRTCLRTLPLLALLAATAACSAGSPSPTVVDAWVKAAEDGMTAAFGTITNPGRGELVVVAASSPAAEAVELHESVLEADGSTTMRQVAGFTVPAGGERELVPGGDHLMLLGLHEPLEPGEEVVVRLELADGSHLEVTAPVKDYAGAQDAYHAGHEG